MPQFAASITQDCFDGAGRLTLNAFGNSAPTQYLFEVRRSDGTDYSVGFGPNDFPVVATPLPNGKYTARVLATDDGGTSYESALRSFTLDCVATPDPDPEPVPDPIYGCTAPNALNFDPTATQDTAPTACEFVAVDVAPSGLVAAHLPIPLVLRVSPTLAGLASIVVVLLDTAATLAGPWVEFGQLKAVCDDTATVRFNLSEAAKSLFRINPPAEVGPDPSLSALLRVRYQAYEPTGQATYKGEAATCRLLNAVQQASSGATLTSPTPYADVPTGGALWASVASYAAGVVSARLPKPSNGCKARQFVWLNAAGAWDSGFFFGRHAHGTDQADPITYRTQTGADRYASRGTVRETLQVYSDVTNWATYKLLRGIRQSIQVYERTAPSQYVPVLLSAESFPEYTEQTDKTFQVNFNVSYPAQLIQTQ